MRSPNFQFVSIIPQDMPRGNIGDSNIATTAWLRDKYPPIMARVRRVEELIVLDSGLLDRYALESTGRQLAYARI